MDQTKCDKCKLPASEKHTSHSTLNLRFKEDESPSDKDRKSQKPKTLTELLTVFTNEEHDVKERCTRCGRIGGVRKQMKLDSNLPKYLAISVDFGEQDGRKKKVPVEVPLSAQYLHKFLHNPPPAINPKNGSAYHSRSGTTGYKLFAFVEEQPDS